MNNKNKNAFPIVNGCEVIYGMSKREYFAGLVLQASIGNNSVMKSIIENDLTFSEYAVLQADELIKALEK